MFLTPCESKSRYPHPFIANQRQDVSLLHHNLRALYPTHPLPLHWYSAQPTTRRVHKNDFEKYIPPSLSTTEVSDEFEEIDLSDPDWRPRSPVLQFSANEVYTGSKGFKLGDDGDKEAGKEREDENDVDPQTSFKGSKVCKDLESCALETMRILTPFLMKSFARGASKYWNLPQLSLVEISMRLFSVWGGSYSVVIGARRHLPSMWPVEAQPLLTRLNIYVKLNNHRCSLAR